MRKLIVLSLVAVGLWAVGVTASPSRALDAESNAIVNGIADMLEKGDAAGAKKAAADAAKKADLEAIMGTMKTRTKKGIGVGTKAGTIMPDGIEMKINAIARDGITAPNAKKEAEALTRAGYVLQAIGQYTHTNPPEKDAGKKTKAAWLEWSDKMISSSQEFIVAAKGSSAADLKKAAGNLKNSCDGCHALFK